MRPLKSSDVSTRNPDPVGEAYKKALKQEAEGTNYFWVLIILLILVVFGFIIWLEFK